MKNEQIKEKGCDQLMASDSLIAVCKVIWYGLDNARRKKLKMKTVISDCKIAMDALEMKIMISWRIKGLESDKVMSRNRRLGIKRGVESGPIGVFFRFFSSAVGIIERDNRENERKKRMRATAPRKPLMELRSVLTSLFSSRSLRPLIGANHTAARFCSR
ncbi:hypothetical protein Cni_G13328 [Canna indica]|uniref:Uncharacterized protein n=1 Tax=Canna indica TaxID=4628 RepID=A0AAQ3QCL1_9LILI|nr:hypothetical protein Cni_G13328 [Canna indica]